MKRGLKDSTFELINSIIHIGLNEKRIESNLPLNVHTNHPTALNEKRIESQRAYRQLDTKDFANSMKRGLKEKFRMSRLLQALQRTSMKRGLKVAGAVSAADGDTVDLNEKRIERFLAFS